MKLSKMILGLECHTYAPELNTLVFVNGAKIRVPNITTIKEAKTKLFSPAKNLRYAKIKAQYPERFSYCNKEYKGYFNNSLELHNFIKQVKEKHTINTDDLLFNDSGISGIITANIQVTFKR